MERDDVFIVFVSSLILLGFIFQLLLMAIALPLALVFAFFPRSADERSDVWSAILNQISLSVVFAGFIAVISYMYDHTRPWSTRGSTRFVDLLRHTLLSARMPTRNKQEWPSKVELAAAHGAGIGALAGLIAFLIFYSWPEAITVIPGAYTFFSLTIGLADWLTGFWIVRIILAIAVLGYLMNAGVMALIGGTLLIGAGWIWFRRLLGIEAEKK